MTEYADDLARTNMFAGIAPDNIRGLLECIRARIVSYAKYELIIEDGADVFDFGVILAGRARSFKWDSSDRLITINLLEKGGEIGVMLAASIKHKSPVCVQALNDVTVLKISYANVTALCPKACPEHERLVRNYMGIVAGKGIMLHERIDCLLKPSVRDKILAYLTRVSRERQSRAFQIPMNRNAMAEYLNTERSALSRELSHMKRDGVIDYHKNHFELM